MKAFITAQAKKSYSRVAMAFAMLLFSLSVFAQDKKLEIDVNTKSDNGNFFSQYWIWIIVGGAVFILLLIALLRNNSSKN